MQLNDKWQMLKLIWFNLDDLVTNVKSLNKPNDTSQVAL